MPGIAFDRLTDALRDAGKDVRGSKAQCPAHDDIQPSLSISPRKDGNGVVVYCHAGCATTDVLAAVGLAVSDLFDDDTARAVYAPQRDYRYPDGRVVHRKPNKAFPQSGNKNGNSLYRADQIGDAAEVYVCEGEKDVEAIELVGGTAVCSAMGAGKAHLADWSPLHGRNVTVIADRDAPGRKHAADIARLLDGKATSVRVMEAAVGKDAADHIAAGKSLGELIPAVTSSSEIEVDEFWSARPILAHLHQFARSRRRCPWAVLGIAMVYANGLIPPGVALPPQAGGRGSLNLFVAPTGPSGAGKGTSESVARDALKFQWHDGQPAELPIFPLGSGEGIARTYMPPPKGKDGLPEREQIITAIFSVPEIDTAAALFARSGSTLESELRKVFSGEQLGFTNAQNHTRTRVEAHTYRAGGIFGVQPGRAGALLDGAAGGTPQRMVWVPVLDADMPDERPDEPEPVTIRQPRFTGDLTVPEVARDAIDAHQLAMHRGTVDPLDGHMLLVRLKVAAALMMLDARNGTPAINDDDWHLAGTVMEISDQTRAWVLRERADAARRSNHGRALATADRDEIVSDRKLTRAKEAVIRWLSRSGETAGVDLRRKLKADLRDNFSAAVSELADDGRIAAIDTAKGVRYRLTEGVHRCTESTPLSSQLSDGVPKYTGVPPTDSIAPNIPSSTQSDAQTSTQFQASPIDEKPAKSARSQVCCRCNVSLPTAATATLCDDCIDAPERPIPPPKHATETAKTVVHNGTMSESSLDFFDSFSPFRTLSAIEGTQ